MQSAMECEVDTAQNGFEALELVKHNADKNIFYDCVILDLNMPIMSGYESCERIFNLFDK